VGGGRGSMAVWLAEQVGPTGQVLATDIDTPEDLEALEASLGPAATAPATRRLLSSLSLASRC